MLKNQIIFGGVSLATFYRSKKAHSIINHILSRGIYHFDTAPLYSVGYSEILLGKALKGIPKIKITSKFGGLGYPNPNTSLPVNFAMPLNFFKRKLFVNKKLIQNRTKSEQKLIPTNMDAVNAIRIPYEGTLKRLQKQDLDSYLLHEILPFNLPNDWEKTLINLKNSRLVKNIGYGGGFSEDLFNKELPYWLDVIQIPFPLNNQNKLDYLKKWLDLNLKKEIRFYGLFRNGFDSNQIKIAKNFLDDYKNVRIVFSSKSIKNIDANLRMFGVL